MIERILIVHNAYQQKGGEDSVVEAEAALLRSRGHQVQQFLLHNDSVEGMSKPQLATRSFWSVDSAKRFKTVAESFKPQIVHVHNTFPLISPSLYWAASAVGLPVVQTLHNFRLMCAQAMFLRDGAVCEQCLGKLPWRGVAYGCYRGSRLQSAVSAGTMTMHRALGTWRDKITVYIALNEFCRSKFIEGGLPAHKILIKPNFVDFAAPGQQHRDGFLFVGRLSREKGVNTLAAAASRLTGCQILVAGTGPEEAVFDGVEGVTRLGHLSGQNIAAQMKKASALVLPSIWYENFPRTLVEAYASGLPVIASRIGALAELVEHEVTGLLSEPGDAADLARKIDWAQQNPQAMAGMGENARRRYEQKYSADINYQQLMDIYAHAAESKRQDGACSQAI